MVLVRAENVREGRRASTTYREYKFGHGGALEFRRVPVTRDNPHPPFELIWDTNLSPRGALGAIIRHYSQMNRKYHFPDEEAKRADYGKMAPMIALEIEHEIFRREKKIRTANLNGDKVEPVSITFKTRDGDKSAHLIRPNLNRDTLRMVPEVEHFARVKVFTPYAIYGIDGNLSKAQRRRVGIVADRRFPFDLIGFFRMTAPPVLDGEDFNHLYIDLKNLARTYPPLERNRS